MAGLIPRDLVLSVEDNQSPFAALDSAEKRRLAAMLMEQLAAGKANASTLPRLCRLRTSWRKLLLLWGSPGEVSGGTIALESAPCYHMIPIRNQTLRFIGRPRFLRQIALYEAQRA
jgi:hypothetical protein